MSRPHKNFTDKRVGVEVRIILAFIASLKRAALKGRKEEWNV